MLAGEGCTRARRASAWSSRAARRPSSTALQRDHGARRRVLAVAGEVDGGARVRLPRPDARRGVVLEIGRLRGRGLQLEEARHGKARRRSHVSLVREGGGGGGEVLLLHLPGLAGRPGHGAHERIAQRPARLGEGRRLHALRAALPGDDARGRTTSSTTPSRSSSSATTRRSSTATGTRSSRAAASRRRAAGSSTGTACGGRSSPRLLDEHDGGQGSGAVEEGHGRDAEDGQARHRDAGARLPVLSRGHSRPNRFRRV